MSLNQEDQHPTVSVLMTAYNREKYIAEAIESVLASTFTDFELIIVDDCSTDQTVAIAKSFESSDNRIKVYVNEKNLGDYPNRNRAASYAKGKYLKYVDSDDILMPSALNIMLDAFALYPKAGLVFTANHHDIEKEFPVQFDPITSYRKYFYKNGLMSKGPSAAMIDTKVFFEFDGFLNKQFVSDTYLWLKIAQRHTIVLVAPDLIFWREHDGQQIFLENQNPLVEKIRLDMNEEILLDKMNPLSNSESQRIIRNLKNIKSRSVLKSFITFNIRKGLNRMKVLQLNLLDLIKSLRPNFKARFDG